MPHLSPMSWLFMFLFLTILLMLALSITWWLDMKNYMPFDMMKMQKSKKRKW
uniref:ATP synthase F0 subunit 8 n=1 Tax=Mooreobdella quaternaria TaxID=3027019 RepID=UPI0023D80E23|nr:ATP synthase F0 subunit 8 [Mooreobdella quaternaria]WDA96113.1 ATP synthase F0 subunit 8 [Mooreobdella quaternaria]